MNPLSYGILAAVLASRTMDIAITLFLVVIAICGWLLAKRRYIILLLWPILIYFVGPALSTLFAVVPVLSRYVFPTYALMETVVIFYFLVSFVVIDLTFDVSTIISRSMHSFSVRQLSSSPLFTFVFIFASSVAIVLQCKALIQFGTIFQGRYAYWASIGSSSASYWGFLAGLYEIIFLCVVLLLLGKHRGTLRFVLISIYAFTALLRLAGGTRLVLVKELAFIVLLLYLEGHIKWRRLVIAAAATILGGTVVGLMRSGGASAGIFGPFYGIAMESALNAMSFNIAYQVYLQGAIHVATQFSHAAIFTAISAVPSFLRFGIQKTTLDAISPYAAGLQAGFDTISPVGGMSGFATLIYVIGNPFVGVTILVATLGLLLRWTPRGPHKQIAILVFSINILHFWRDGLDISVKLFVQDMLCALAFLYLPEIQRRARQAPVALQRLIQHASR